MNLVDIAPEGECIGRGDLFHRPTNATKQSSRFSFGATCPRILNRYVTTV
jgi:hypothetical protein